MVSSGTIWMVLRVLLGLVPVVVDYVKRKKHEGVGEDKIVDEILKEFRDVNERAEEARDAARDDIDSGGLRSDDGFKRK